MARTRGIRFIVDATAGVRVSETFPTTVWVGSDEHDEPDVS
jgi:hypothetical protein